MKLTMKRQDLCAMLKKVEMVMPKRTALPILSNVLLRAEKNTLVDIAGGLEVFLAASCRAKVAEPGAICLPPGMLLDFLGQSAAETISLSTEGDRVSAQLGKATAKLKAGKAEDYPPVPEVKGQTITLPSLAKALSEVVYAVATEESRPVLASVYFNPVGKARIELVGADGFRLAITRTGFTGTAPEKGFMVPRAALPCLLKLFPRARITIGEPLPDAPGAYPLLFEANGLRLFCRSVPGTFPNYQQLLPHGQMHRLTVSVPELKAAIAKAKPESGIIRLMGQGGKLTVSWRIDDENTFEAKLPAKGTIKVALNIKYLLDLLRREGPVTFLTTSPTARMMVKQGPTIQVCMPMFVQW